ncbi:hypothetical protein [Streptomyces sp. NPDC002580]|uniref:hypothetical protein n=1 Tax=Streptomyces sp. NPDC002580 TaxID=3364653 RepID=UPI0036B96712
MAEPTTGIRYRSTDSWARLRQAPLQPDPHRATGRGRRLSTDQEDILVAEFATEPDSEFLTRVSEVAFDLGQDRFRLTSLGLRSRTMEFSEVVGPSEPPVYFEGEPPGTGREARRVYDWQPAADAPSWMNMAWLLDDLAAWVDQMAGDGITLVGLEAPEPHWCDVLVLDGDTRCRVRMALADRRDVLDFPGMYLREMFAEGRYDAYLTEDRSVVDLRGVL